MPESVTVRVPATSANLGPGFDALGIALEITGNVTVSVDPRAGSRQESRADALALTAAKATFQKAGRQPPAGLRARYEGDIPVGRGMGASAVLRVGAVVAANALLGNYYDQEQALLLATELEGHADNVAPALFGGFQVCVWAGGVIHHIQVPLPAGLQAVVLVPDLDMPTNESRKLLPVSLERRDCVHNIGRAALLVAALATGRLDVLHIATQDVLHQPARSKLFPEMFDIFQAAVNAGAHCAYLSGGGSSILALASDNGDRIGEAMLSRLKAAGRTGNVRLTRPSAAGAEIIRTEG